MAPGVTTSVRERLIVIGRGGAGDARSAVPLVFQPVEVGQVLRVKAQVGAVVAQEALRIDRARQLSVLTTLERREVPRPDLRVALDAGQVDALRFASGPQDLTELVELVVLVHRSSSSGSISPPQPSLVTSTSRKRLPSAAPTMPRSSIWSRMRAARA